MQKVMEAMEIKEEQLRPETYQYYEKGGSLEVHKREIMPQKENYSRIFHPESCDEY